MRTTTLQIPAVLLAVVLPATAVSAAAVNGTVKLGGVIMNQSGDRTAVQETYNVFDGFSVNQIRLDGTTTARDFFTLDVREINLDSRKADFVYRRPGLFKVNGAYDQHRQVFTPDAAVRSDRKDWKVGAQMTPVEWLGVSGYYNRVTREGDRTGFPDGQASVLGTRYDHTLQTGGLTADAHRGRIGGAVSWHVSDFADGANGDADRTGQVVSARLYMPCQFYDRWTHLLRGAYGVSKHSESDLEQTLKRFEYTGVIAPIRPFEFKYNFDASRVDDDATDLQTDRFQNDFDATVFHPLGQVSGGYGYETNDDDRTLTHYHSWRAGTVFRLGKRLTARFHYAGRNKKDQEELTLLKDVEANRLRARLQIQPFDALTIGGGYARREREFPDIDVEAEGEAADGFARLAVKGWGSVSAEYNWAEDSYDDRLAGYDARSDIVTGRVDIERIPNLRVGGGVTYLDIGEDLDIEKSMVFVEGAYTLQDRYRIEVKYNVYNYDDYILLDRYYTANVLRINVGYDFNLK